VCASIRTAKLINGYAPQLEAWSSSWFVTLTAPNVAGSALADEVARYLTAFSNIVRIVREKQRIRFRALRKLECTYNSTSNTYHPHFHVIVDSEAAARAIVAGWLRRWPAAVESAQDVRKADSEAVRELFKYFTKIVTKTTQPRPGGLLGGVDHRVNVIHTRSLDTIFQAVRGRRTFQPYGLKAVREEIDPKELEATVQIGAWPTDYYWNQIAADWIDPTTGAALAQYQPSPAVAALLERVE
jgi:diadenosine tetraphosphate (Ap4A) HIT family hydrolase